MAMERTEDGRIHMKRCPRCHGKTMFNSDALNAISRVDGKTRICSNCGKMEGYIASGLAKPDEYEIAFRKRLGMEAGQA